MTQKKIGVFVGKFLPPHIGHIGQIKKCSRQCDTLFVVIADSRHRSRQICDEAGIKTIYAGTRLKWLKKELKNEKNIKFFKLDEGLLEAFPENIENWKMKFHKKTKGKVNIWFVDKNYLEISKKYFSEYEFVGFDRSEIDISATKIRNDLKNNIDFIIPSAKSFFEKYLKNDSV